MAKKAVFALANNSEHADRIVTRLQSIGINYNAISVLMADREGKIEYNEDVPRVYQEREVRSSFKKGTLGTEKHSKAPEGGVVGATTGGIIGGSLGLLAGIGALAIPGFGVFIAAGPIIAALSGSAVGGAVGLLVGFLAGLGIPEYEAKKYESELKSGSVLIAVQVVDSAQTDSVKDVLKKEGAKDISTTSETTVSRK